MGRYTTRNKWQCHGKSNSILALEMLQYWLSTESIDIQSSAKRDSGRLALKNLGKMKAEPMIAKKETYLLLNAVLVSSVSIGVFFAFVIRDCWGVNGNTVLLALASGSAFTAWRFSRKPIWLTASYLIFSLSIVPTIFGWIIFLYLPSFVLMSAIIIFTWTRSIVGRIR